MDAFQHAIDYVKWEIPEEILEDAIIDKRSRFRRTPGNLDDRIRSKIIKERVMRDLENIGGVGIQIILNGLPFTKLSTYERIYRIPITYTQGRLIVRASKVVLNVTSNYAERVPGQSHRSIYVSPIERSVQSVIASHRSVPNISNTDVEILGDNVLKIQDYYNFSSDIMLDCHIQYSHDFHELPRAYWNDFADLVTAATKMYTYKQLSLRLDKTRLEGGRDYGRYKEYVEEFRDANQVYRQLIDEKWGVITTLADSHSKNKHILNSGKIKV